MKKKKIQKRVSKQKQNYIFIFTYNIQTEI